ncbi:MAG: hypothetical protein CM1200mP2_40180 [Planctomycetaceae bacterium]|nr:MAG: hypothetical protein CM1200mP2_40180 [Planctomycetaceae bacterium]
MTAGCTTPVFSIIGFPPATPFPDIETIIVEVPNRDTRSAFGVWERSDRSASGSDGQRDFPCHRGADGSLPMSPPKVLHKLLSSDG